MSENSKPSFGPIRSILWPIYRRELGLVLPMIFMLFFTCLNYSILRNLKDSLVITAKNSGAEVIPFIKVWAMLPMAILVTYIFAKLSNRYSQERVYYIIVTGFLSVYALLAFVLYPNREILHPNITADLLAEILPAGCKGLIAMFRNWTLTLFYVFSELWSTMVMTVLFWGFANEVTRVGAAKRIYAIFGVASNFAAVAAGVCGLYFSSPVYNPNLPFGNDAIEQWIMMAVLFVIVMGIAILSLFYWINRHVLTSAKYEDLHSAIKPAKDKKKKKRLSMRDSMRHLSSSTYLACIAIIVVSYNLVINLVEVVWKGQLKELYSDAGAYNIHLSYVTIVIGLISTVVAFFIGKLINRYGWTKTTLITPVLMLFTSAGFFGFILFDSALESVAVALQLSPLAFGVYFGSAQNCLSKASKYSVFDTTKEMAFIPLDHEQKLKGKAAIDGVGSRLGKSGGSVIHQGLFLLTSSLAASIPYIAGILLTVIVCWIGAIRVLGGEFSSLRAQRRSEAEAEAATSATTTA